MKSLKINGHEGMHNYNSTQSVYTADVRWMDATLAACVNHYVQRHFNKGNGVWQ